MRTPGSTAAVTGERVLTAAAAAFARDGYAATGIRRLAGDAGLTPAALYHYMGAKEDLLVAVMRSTIEPLLGAATALVAEDPQPDLALAGLVELQVWVHGTQPEATLVADTEVRALRGRRRTAMLGLRDRYEAVWRGVVAEGMRTGDFAVEDASLTTKALLGLAGQVSQWYSPGGRLPLEAVCALHADLALGMVRARRRCAELDLAPPAGRLALSA
jgi:AcrR family transcriptional regulator